MILKYRLTFNPLLSDNWLINMFKMSNDTNMNYLHIFLFLLTNGIMQSISYLL